MSLIDDSRDYWSIIIFSILSLNLFLPSHFTRTSESIWYCQNIHMTLKFRYQSFRTLVDRLKVCGDKNQHNSNN